MERMRPRPGLWARPLASQKLTGLIPRRCQLSTINCQLQDPKNAEPQVETAEEQQAAQAEAANAEAEAPAPEQPSAEEKLAEADAELAKVKKALSEADIRAQAEIQNVRKRAERDVQHARKFALEKFAGDLLSVADNLERGLAALDANDDALQGAREGIELTLKSLLDAFAKYNLEQISPSDEPFTGPLKRRAAAPYRCQTN